MSVVSVLTPLLFHVYTLTHAYICLPTHIPIHIYYIYIPIDTTHIDIIRCTDGNGKIECWTDT